jgi:hypothetical protein
MPGFANRTKNLQLAFLMKLSIIRAADVARIVHIVQVGEKKFNNNTK